MDDKRFSKEIQTRIESIKNSLHHDNNKALTCCQELLDYAKETNDTALLGLVYYYLAEAHFLLNHYKLFMQCLVNGIRYQQDSGQADFLARSYNMLAISADSRGNYISALDHYLTALSYCKKENLIYESGLIYTNIGHLYATLHDFHTASRYFHSGIQYFKKKREEIYAKTNISLSYLALANSHYNMGNIERAFKYINRYINDYQTDPFVKEHSLIAFASVYTKLLSADGRIEERDRLIGDTVPTILKASSLLDSYYEVFDFCEHLFTIGRYPEFCSLLRHLDAITEGTGLLNIHLRILRLWIQYYEKIGDEQQRLCYTSRYFELSQQQAADDRTIALSTINLRFTLEKIQERQNQIEKENLIFKKRSETDSLTGLPNRYLLNRYADEAFERARSNNYSLAVELFDVDCFKQFNDTYGHQAGDQCLCSIAGILKKLCGRDIFCARYGGDEFILFYENKTDEEIRSFAEKLKEQVVSLKLENKNSTVAPYVTISQGIRNSIPCRENKLWDYLFAADAALYQVKKTAKSGICLVHKTIPQNPCSQEIAYRNE